jgi:VWFA-related protein
VFVLAIDSFSFKPSESSAMALTAKAFVDHLRPADRVGIFAYPLGPTINPTTDHAAVRQALDKVVGQREPIPKELEDLQLRDILTLSTLYETGGTNRAIECAFVRPDLCMGLADAYTVELEHIANRSFESLGDLMNRLQAVPGRKVVVLISAGLAAQPPHAGGHPDLGDLPKRVGTAAAQAGATIYTLFVDPGLTEMNLAEHKSAPNTASRLANLAENNNILEQTLDHFSGMAGGAFVRVIGGNPELAFDRIVTETSGYYLLGVRADKSDQDGKPHPLTAKVDEKGATVRGRSWVQIPLAAGK